MCFAWWSLSVCENSSIESFKCTLYNFMANFCVDLLLSGLSLKNLIKRKPMIRLTIPHLNSFSININTWLRLFFFLVQWSNTNKYFYAIPTHIWILLILLPHFTLSSNFIFTLYIFVYIFVNYVIFFKFWDKI